MQNLQLNDNLDKGLNLRTLTLEPKKSRNFFASQLGLRDESLEKAYRVISAISKAHISLEDQRRVCFEFYGYENYHDPYVAKFSRTTKKGEVISCLLCLQGHHRIAEAFIQGKSIEVCIFGDLGNIGRMDNGEYIQVINERERAGNFPQIDYLVRWFNTIPKDHRLRRGTIDFEQ